ncbi:MULTISPECIES: pyridoxal-dependent decarboxylase [unclassified Streptomyces]|uniref:pyridoxal phosphate-dependent decarboxylase family protein n=1 Tax=unclassified Streptomyces TaxID=2593676 RepID=UPI0022527BC5|nr:MULTISPECIES: pyridoxal-dependent decarboxylase [unclassified Streptomyces]MCX4525872.1 pyridoxal-dependent decarboxylase [Streptomyces sp. NBC_01551]MCX4543566.1 pyridoxal-dependent decarboxylase [Streptomyces sp. NBC_01565]
MDRTLAADLARLPELLDATRRAAADALATLDTRPVVVPGATPPPEPLPDHGVGADAALAAFRDRWEPRLSATAGPRYLGFVTGGATPAALAGDWLTAAHDQNSNSALDGAGQDLERETVGWLRELFGISDAHSGTFVSGATMSNTTGLAIAREWLGERLGVRVAEDGAAALGRVRVLSGAPHSSIAKALAVLGLGRAGLVPVPTLPGREAVDPAALDRALADTPGPAVVVANAGTVNTVDFDDLRAVAALKRRHDFWLHTDAAFGAFAALSPEHAHLAAGLDASDSLCVDLHKWLNVPYDSAVQFTRRQDLQARVFQNAAAYLGPLGSHPDLVHLTPENSHRLRALAAWFTLRAYGRQGHREIVERDIACARALGAELDADPAFRLLAPVRLNVVCFTLAEDPTPARLTALREAAGAEVFVTPTVLAGTPALRAAFSNWRTTQADVRRAAEALRTAAREIA